MVIVNGFINVLLRFPEIKDVLFYVFILTSKKAGESMFFAYICISIRVFGTFALTFFYIIPISTNFSVYYILTRISEIAGEISSFHCKPNLRAIKMYHFCSMPV
jgi:hypothetical protein